MGVHPMLVRTTPLDIHKHLRRVPALNFALPGERDTKEMQPVLDACPFVKMDGLRRHEYRKIKRLFHRPLRHAVLGSARTPHAARPGRAAPPQAPPPAAPAADQRWMQQASRRPAPPRREPGDGEAARLGLRCRDKYGPI